MIKTEGDFSAKNRRQNVDRVKLFRTNRLVKKLQISIKFAHQEGLTKEGREGSFCESKDTVC